MDGGKARPLAPPTSGGRHSRVYLMGGSPSSVAASKPAARSRASPAAGSPPISSRCSFRLLWRMPWACIHASRPSSCSAASSATSRCSACCASAAAPPPQAPAGRSTSSSGLGRAGGAGTQGGSEAGRAASAAGRAGNPQCYRPARARGQPRARGGRSVRALTDGPPAAVLEHQVDVSAVRHDRKQLHHRGVQAAAAAAVEGQLVGDLWRGVGAGAGDAVRFAGAPAAATRGRARPCLPGALPPPGQGARTSGSRPSPAPSAARLRLWTT
jgi:hypothetical protein